MTPRCTTDRPLPARVSRLLDLFLLRRENANCEPVTLADYRRAVERFALYEGTPDDVAEWRDEHLDAWLADLKRAGLASGTRAWYQRHLWVFLGFLVEREECGVDRRGNAIDPRKGIPRVVVESVKRRTATPEITTRVLTVALDGRHEARDMALIHMLRATGARRAELAAVDVADIDLDEALVLLRHTKGKRQRVQPFDGPCRAALMEWLLIRGDTPGPLFTSERGGRLTAEGMKLVLRRLADRAKVEATSHDYRRGFAVQMRQKGLDVGHVANLLGHRTLAMAMLYAQEGEEAAAIDAYRRATG